MNLKKTVGWSLAALLFISLGRTAIAEEENAFSAGVSAGYSSKYIWRGQNVNDSSVLKTNVSGNAYRFTGSIWSNIDLTNDSQFAPDNAGEFSEIDYTLDYSRSFSKVGFSLGVIHYLFPNTPFQSTTEIYGGLGFAIPLSPKITWYRDVNSIDGSYIQITAGHAFEKIAAWDSDYYVGLSLSGSLAFAGSGYNSGYFGINKTKFNDLTVSIGIPFNLKHVSITPGVNFSTMLDEDIGHATYERNNVWFGVGLSKSF
ncbi:MAG: hypothetical protein JXA73_06405 [Acidobacteria bacterium]|nr:hypothetical protein [Acidobacteriota bacterium]